MVKFFQKAKELFQSKKREEYELEAKPEEDLFAGLNQNEIKLKKIEFLLDDVIKNNRSFLTPTDLKAMKKILNDSSLSADDKLNKIEKTIEKRMDLKDPKRDPLLNQFDIGVYQFIKQGKTLPNINALKNYRQDLLALNQFIKHLPDDNAGVKMIKDAVKNPSSPYQNTIDDILKLSEKKEIAGNNFCRLFIDFVRVQSQAKGSFADALKNPELYTALKTGKNELEQEGKQQALQDSLSEAGLLDQKKNDNKSFKN